VTLAETGHFLKKGMLSQPLWWLMFLCLHCLLLWKVMHISVWYL